MSDLLEYLALGVAGIAVYFVAENNIPAVKKTISSLNLPSISNIVPVFTEAPRAPVPVSKHCPPGMYADFTDGILTCRDAHGTRELNPNVVTNPIYRAWGDGYANDILKSPGLPSIETVLPVTQKQIDEQKKRDEEKKKHKKKLARIPDNQKVHAQIECSDNLKCGSNCYKDGKLYKIVCSEAEKEALYPKKKKPPSLIVPPNYPNEVIVTPGPPPPLTPGGIANPIGETPYPENEGPTQDIGGTAPAPTVGQTNPDFNPPPPSLDLIPGQQPIRPTIPPTSPTPIAPAPQLGTVFYPFRPAADKKGFASHPYDADGCRVVDYHSGGSGWTCRWQADNNTMKQNIGENGYKIEATLHIGSPKTEKDKEISITSGGPGSTEGNCCGFTTRINIDTGTLQFEAEGSAHTEVQYCKGASCVPDGMPSSIGKNLYGKDIKLTWIVTRKGSSAIYQAIATGPLGTVVSKAFSSDNVVRARGQPLIPFHYIAVGNNGIASDPHRIRVDSADMKGVYFGTPKVTVIHANAYYGDLGYIHGDEDLLI